MESNLKALARPGYLLAFLLVVIPSFDSVMSTWPLRFGDERWRFGAVGAFSNITLVPLLGLLLAVTFAVLLDQRRTRKILGWVCTILALVFGATIVVFLLDYFQTRATVPEDYKNAMDIATYTSIAKQVFTVFILALLSGVGLSGPKISSRKSKGSGAPSKGPGKPLIPLTTAARDD